MNPAVIKISSKGQVTLPASICRELKSDRLSVVLDRGAIKMRQISMAEITHDFPSEEKDLLQACEASLDFWDNPEDEVWNDV